VLPVLQNRPDDILASGTHRGFDWVVMHNGMGFRCGYVRVPADHPWAAIEWHGSSFDAGVRVHGGVTFVESDTYTDGRWIGFDCGHYGDAPDPNLPHRWTASDMPMFSGDAVRTQGYVEYECRSLCEQAAEAV